jgi:hypothetical protein
MRATCVAVVAAGLLLLTGCGDDESGGGGTTSTSAPPSGSTTSTTAADSDGQDFELPDTPLTAVLDSTYPVAGFDAETFGVQPGSVTAAWYSVGDRWAVHYAGLSREDANGKCPGNSIQVEDGFEHISNSPFGALACSGYEDLPNYAGTILPPGSLHVCGESTIVYVTEIPLSAEGTLYASLEQVLDDGTVQGMTSMVVADAEQAPEITLGAECAVVS